ncbi:MAG: VanW family protein [bacterium]
MARLELGGFTAYTRRRKAGRRVGLRVILAIAALLVALSIADFLLGFGRIYHGVRVGTLDVGGMTRGNAAKRIEAVARKLASEPIMLVYGDRSWTLDPVGDAGLQIDVEKTVYGAFAVGRNGNFMKRVRDRLKARRTGVGERLFVRFDEPLLRRSLERVADSINSTPQNARFDGNRMVFARLGREVNIDATMEIIRQKLSSMDNSPVEILVKETPPDVTSEMLRERLGFPDVISSYETQILRIPSQMEWLENKIYNMRLAAQKIDGTIVSPNNGRFSFTETVGPDGQYMVTPDGRPIYDKNGRRIPTGFKEALVVWDGQFVPGYGGGVCQVSTTLYNTALLAGMEITRRYNHGVYADTLEYVPKGRDAAVAYGYKDLVFRNPTNKPILIHIEVTDTKVKIVFYGKKEDNRIVDIVTTDPVIIKPGVEIIEDPNLPEGEMKAESEGLLGYSLDVYRVVKVGDKEIGREKLYTDTYRARPAVIRVGKRGR